MGWLLIVLLILVAIITVAAIRNRNHDYRMGSGLFKNSEYNLDEKDVKAIAAHIMGQTPDGFNLKNADVNGDESITVTDVMLIVKLVLKKE